VTNDDGVTAPGLRVLAEALFDAGHEVLVVAPDSDRSGAGAAIGALHQSGSLPVVEHHWDRLPLRVLSLDAPPATAVYAACIGAFGDAPEAVFSGINPGANTGHLVLHSGTVGAALTGAGLGVPGVAVSMKWSDDGYHWETAARLAVAACPWVEEHREPVVLNINTPNLPFDGLRGVEEAELASYGEVWLTSAHTRAGDLRMELEGRLQSPDPGSDAALILEGFATVTPLVGIVRADVDGGAAAIRARIRRGDGAAHEGGRDRSGPS